MAVDFDRYNALIARAAFRAEYFRGTIQDLSPAQRAMTFLGAPSWRRINGYPCLRQNVAADGTTSGNVAAVVDVTGTFTIECCLVGNTTGTDYVLTNLGAGLVGGFAFYRQGPANNRCVITLYDAAGVAARELDTPIGSVPLSYVRHCIMVSVAGGTSGFAWVNDTPVVVTLALAGVAANHAGARPIIAAGGNAGLQSSLLIRCWQGALTNEDVSCLAEQAKLMVGGF